MELCVQHRSKRHVKNAARRRNLLESHGIFRLHVSRPASISSTPLFFSLLITNHLRVPLSARLVRDCSPPHLATRDSQSQGIFGLQMDLTSNQCNFFFAGLFIPTLQSCLASFPGPWHSDVRGRSSFWFSRAGSGTHQLSHCHHSRCRKEAIKIK